MPSIILTENQYINLIDAVEKENTIDLQDLQEKWDNLSENTKEFILEYLCYFNNADSKILKENKWYNTVGDILGIFDPSGLVDLINGFSYLNQGDYFFGLLSMVSVIPYVGDAVAKPLIGLGKTSKLVKGIDEALKITRAGGDVAKASKIIEEGAKSSSLIAKFVESSAKWGPKLTEAIKKIPMVPKGLKKVIIDWIELFTKAAGTSKTAVNVSKNLAKQIATKSPKEAAELIKTFKAGLKNDAKLFKNFKPKDPSFMAKYFWPGFTLGLRRNRDLVSLTRRTKFWAGFLDFIGMGNFVGPEEVVNKLGVEESDKLLRQYANSKEGQDNMRSDYSSAPDDATSDSEQGDQSNELLKQLISMAVK